MYTTSSILKIKLIPVRAPSAMPRLTDIFMILLVRDASRMAVYPENKFGGLAERCLRTFHRHGWLRF
jgi:hypothetical protein